jgi:SAM-dependent methyltransferase
MTFKNHDEAHAHSLQTLNQLYEYDDFMSSIRTVADLGCGVGKDLEWWATRTTRDDAPEPLNIACQGIDIIESCPVVHHLPNATYQQTDFEKKIHPPAGGFDVLWCHNAFQYAISPIQTLAHWHSIAADGGMLCIAVPQTTNLYLRDVDFTQQDGVYYHYTIVNLIHMLALAGWDCRSGFFKKSPEDNWLHAVVYKSTQGPKDARTTRWYDLAESGLLPETAVKSINAKGYLDQKDLVLPWLNKSLSRFNY